MMGNGLPVCRRPESGSALRVDFPVAYVMLDPFDITDSSCVGIDASWAGPKSLTVRSSMPTWRILVPGMNPSLSTIYAHKAAGAQTTTDASKAMEQS